MITTNLQDFSILIQPPARLLGIDYGKKKLGIAISTPEQTISLPLQQLVEADLHVRLSIIAKIIQKFNVKALVIGLPINMDGTSTEQVEIVKLFARQLYNKFQLPIYLQDERLTSKAASNALKIAGFSRNQRDMLDDQIAASMILETTLLKLQRLPKIAAELRD